MNDYEKFYQSINRDEYAAGFDLANDNFYKDLAAFIDKHNLKDKKVLEIGSGNGKYQDIISDYTGLDVAESLSKFYHKRFVVLEDKKYPFSENSFDFIFTTSVFEHVPKMEIELKEMLRVLKNNGLILFQMAWQVRPWLAQGYNVRPYSDLDLRGKFIKFLIPLRDSVWFRLVYIVPQRLRRTIRFLFNQKSFIERPEYKKLKANYEIYYGADSDACNSVDPHAMILYFMANGCRVINYPNLLKAFFIRTGNLEICKI